MRIGALVLAAGRSTRMGERNKLTTRLDGKPLVCHAVDALLASQVDEILVVTGHDERAVRRALSPRRVRFERHSDFEAGMGVSLAFGISKLANVDAALVCLGDMPRVATASIDALIAAFAGPASILVPIHRGRRGHPVLFGAAHFEALRALRGDRGARDVLLVQAKHVREIETEDPGIHQDFDLESDFDSDLDRADPESGPD